jgi:predicted Zn-dependent protease
VVRGSRGACRWLRWASRRGWYLALGVVVLGYLSGCSAAVGRVTGQRFISPRYAFEVRLPGEAWQVVANDPAVLTLTHPHLAAGITVNVTCDRAGRAPLDILTRHLFFGFKHVEVLRQEPQALNGVSALKTVARAWLDARELLVSSYIIQHHDCVYDVVYFASPQDFPRGEADFERLVAQFRFLN